MILSSPENKILLPDRLESSCHTSGDIVNCELDVIKENDLITLQSAFLCFTFFKINITKKTIKHVSNLLGDLR